MKEYKYKINGNEYTVGIGDIDHNIVEVEVNGTSYTVELEKTETPEALGHSPKSFPSRSHHSSSSPSCSCKRWRRRG